MKRAASKTAKPMAPEDVELLSKPVKRSAGAEQMTTLVLENGLTVEQEAYARMRAFGLTQKEAITMATNGRVTSQTAGNNMEKRFKAVRDRINDLTKSIADKVVETAAANKSWVMARLMKITDRCMQEEPVLDKEGNSTGEYVFDASGANRALELIGKELGMFVNRTKVDVGSDLEQMTDEHLTRIAQELAAQIGLDTGSPADQEAPGREQTLALPAVQKTA